jgi:hypothetical protein
MDRPGLTVTLIFSGQQITIGRIQINTDQYRLPALENLVMTGSTHRAQVFSGIELARLRHRLHDAIMDAAQRQGAVQHLTEKRHHPPEGTVA